MELTSTIQRRAVAGAIGAGAVLLAFLAGEPSGAAGRDRGHMHLYGMEGGIGGCCRRQSAFGCDLSAGIRRPRMASFGLAFVVAAFGALAAGEGLQNDELL